MSDPDIDAIVDRLAGPTCRGDLVLFTGAGFTAGLSNISGTMVPSAIELRDLIWSLAFTGTPDDSSTLQEVFDVALRECPDDLSALLRSRLSIDASALTPAMLRWLGFPWKRAYSLNIDDFALAGAATAPGDREITPLSALRIDAPPDSMRALAWLHLNGDLADVPNVTFSEMQYANRSTREDVLFSRLVSDLTVSPVVFVGSSLREPQLWRYLELRRLHDPAELDLQPTSFLVAPSLSQARAAMLSGMNIEWVQLDATEFSDRVLVGLKSEADTGRRVLSAADTSDTAIANVTDLLGAAKPDPTSRYLEGAQPQWSDLLGDRTLGRPFEVQIPVEQAAGTLLVIGTAGEGVSTTLMRLAARLNAAGRETLWCSGRDLLSAQRVRAVVRTKGGDFALLVDDADMIGPQLEQLVRDLRGEPKALLVLGMRSARVDNALPDWAPEDARSREIVVPKLEDADIEGLLGLLERQNQLGFLASKTAPERAQALRTETGRLLLVAMLMATQGRDLREKVEDEFSQLAQPQRSIYAAIALASQYRYGINRDEVLHAADALTAVGATALERLVKRQLVVAKRGGLESRHRMVAELVTQRMRADGTLAGAYGRLLVALAMRQSPAELKDPGLRQRSRRYRVTQTLMNHRSLDGFRMREARAIYSGAEPYLSQDYHYWLQRGSFEVRRGDRDRAERYLLRSRAEGGDNDFRVDVETYYLQVKKAAANPADGAAVTLADEAYAGLVHMIDTRGQQSAYPFHVLLSQYPKWLAAANLTVGEKRLKFEDLRRLANRAVRQHGNDAGMQDLQRSIEREYLSLAVAKTGRGGGRGRGRSRGGRPS